MEFVIYDNSTTKRSNGIYKDEYHFSYLDSKLRLILFIVFDDEEYPHSAQTVWLEYDGDEENKPDIPTNVGIEAITRVSKEYPNDFDLTC